MKKLLAILISFAFSCSDNTDAVVVDDCSQPVGCTFELRTISLKIKDKSGNPYKLDDYYITKLATGKKIETKFIEDLTLQQKYGTYPLLGDGNMKDTNKDGQAFGFTGRKNGKVVISKSFLIGHNCCHIELKKGETEVVITD